MWQWYKKKHKAGVWIRNDKNHGFSTKKEQYYYRAIRLFISKAIWKLMCTDDNQDIWVLTTHRVD